MEYLSKRLNADECNYLAIECEFSGLIQALYTWQHYLLGRNVTAHTDHASLQWVTTQPHLLRRQVHWLEFISEFDLTISHMSRKANVVANALSRHHDLDPANCANIMTGTEYDLLNSIKRAQEHDQTVRFSDLKSRALANEHGICMH